MSKFILFPHISRIFSAAILWMSLVLFLSVNIVNIPKPGTNVLGVVTEFQNDVRRAQIEREETLASYRYWQTVIYEKPDYRDAYIQLAALSYQLKFIDEGREYLNRALALDPNNSVISSLLEVFRLEAQSL